MALVKTKHQTIVASKINELITDLGAPMYVHMRAAKTDCTWCEYSNEVKASTGQPSAGKDWTTHANYQGTLRLCPNCLGKGTIQGNDIVTVAKVIESDGKGLTLVNGRPALMPDGSKKITGDLSTIDSNKIITFADDESATIANAAQSGLNVLTDDFMVEAWVKVSTLAGDRLIIRKGTADRFVFQLDGENIQMIISDGSTTASTVTSLDAGTITDDAWHHIVACIDRSGVTTIYVDGVAITSYSTQDDNSTVVGSITNSASFFMGGNGTLTSIVGDLDEVRVWRFGVGGLPSDITTAIKFHFDNAHSLYKTLRNTSFLKGRWTMQESFNPTTLQDSSGNRNLLTLTGGTISRASVGNVRGIVIDDIILFDATKIVLFNIDYQLFTFKALKLIDNFSFQAILKRAESTGTPANAQ